MNPDPKPCGCPRTLAGRLPAEASAQAGGYAEPQTPMDAPTLPRSHAPHDDLVGRLPAEASVQAGGCAEPSDYAPTLPTLHGHRTPFFISLPAQDLLLREAKSWLGTPFFSHGKVKDGGVDCVQLALALYQATGFVGQIELPEYSIQGGNNRDESQIEQFLSCFGRLESWFAAEGILDRASLDFVCDRLMPGDLLVFRLGRVSHHMGVCTVPTRFLHVLQDLNVTESDLRDATMHTRLVRCYRPLVGRLPAEASAKAGGYAEPSLPRSDDPHALTL